MSMTTFMTLELLYMLLVFALIQPIVLEGLSPKSKPSDIENNIVDKNSEQIFKFNLFGNVNGGEGENKLNTNKNVACKLQTMEKKTKMIKNYNNNNNSIKINNKKLMKRLKRQHLSTSSSTSMTALNHHHQLSLPSVPLPPPPPFPHHNTNFNLSPFKTGSSAGVGKSMNNAFIYQNHHYQQTHSSSSSSSSLSLTSHKCGGVLKARHGVIQTPNFPHKFITPIECVWIIDASELMPHSVGHNMSIVVYLTQLYVLGGLKFTEYMYYSDDYKVPAHRVFTLTEDDVTQVAWVQFNSQYLEIRFRMSTLDGTHLRALDRLLDVYGFNMTYEVETVKDYQCNTLQCRFLGHCYAKPDFSSYYCSCFAGFSGIDCGRGPLCEDPHTNICQNGGTCKHIGDAAITCHCPAGFKGTKCEIPDISEITMGCTTNASVIDCHRECDFDNSPQTSISLLKSSHTSTRSGKTRYEVTIRLGANLTAYYRNIEAEQKAKEQLPSFLEKHLMRVLRNFNITKISDLELISNTTDRLDITFHFFGIKGDSNRIREAITRMVERGKIGNITLVSNYHLFDENPPLNLLDLNVNQKQVIRENSEFLLSCTAQGSARMQFQWFKDGIVVNASKATR